VRRVARRQVCRLQPFTPETAALAAEKAGATGPHGRRSCVDPYYWCSKSSPTGLLFSSRVGVVATLCRFPPPLTTLDALGLAVRLALYLLSISSSWNPGYTIAHRFSFSLRSLPLVVTPVQAFDRREDYKSWTATSSAGHRRLRHWCTAHSPYGLFAR
jgi:hypothetical protein